MDLIWEDLQCLGLRCLECPLEIHNITRKECHKGLQCTAMLQVALRQEQVSCLHDQECHKGPIWDLQQEAFQLNQPRAPVAAPLILIKCRLPFK